VENDVPFISIIVPCRNEEEILSDCLDSILTQDYPRDKVEILIVDGMSQDCTRQIIESYTTEHMFIKLLDNPGKTTPCALNVGTNSSAGDIILIMGAHSVYERGYVSKCVNNLIASGADNVGGVCKIMPKNDSLVAKSIAYVLASPFGAGNSYYRIGSKRPRYVDTLFGGCLKKEIFDKVGFFDEDLIRGQDTEFNARIRKNGGRILLIPDITSYYYARDSLYTLWKMELQYGYFKPLVVKKVGKVFTLRQLVPPLFVCVLAVLLILSIFSHYFLWLFIYIVFVYGVVSLLFSLKIARQASLKYCCVLPLVFAIVHFGWASGYLKGIWDFIILKKDERIKIQDLPLTR
jgi:cellulose synthase/poly-beta-1,6-N-acetylglucosamine synthase-like glycosyltransferase